MIQVRVGITAEEWRNKDDRKQGFQSHIPSDPKVHSHLQK